MITGYIGAKGSGKTLNMVRDAMEQMRWGKRVVSNLKIEFEWRGKTLKSVFIKDSQEFKKALIYEKKCLLLIDEASVFLSNYHWNRMPPEIIAKLAQERHFGMDMLYTTQGFGHTVSRLRNLTDETFLCSRRRFFGLSGLPMFPFFRRKWNNKYRKKQWTFATTEARIFYKQKMRLSYWSGVQSAKKYHNSLISTEKIYPAEQRRLFKSYDTLYIVEGSALVKMGKISGGYTPPSDTAHEQTADAT